MKFLREGIENLQPEQYTQICFCSRDLDLDPTTLTYDILKMYLTPKLGFLSQEYQNLQS